MSALPVEKQPPGAVPADSGSRSRGSRSRPGVTAAQQAVHPLVPARKWLMPDGDCIFPGGGRSFSGQAAPGGARPPQRRPLGARRLSRPAAAAPRPSRPLTSVQALPGPVAAAPGRLTEGGRRALAVPAATRGHAASAGQSAARGHLAGTGHAASAGQAATRGQSAGTVSPRLRLTRRGRVVVAVLAVLAACGLFVAGASAAQASGPTSAHGASAAAELVVVQPGETLWSIAQSADPNADARAIVQEILQANRLKTASITAGQRLWVPRR